MKSLFVAAIVSLSLTSCAEQIRFGTSQTRSTIPEILEDQALANVASASYNRLAIPAQIKLKDSLTSTVNSIDAGIAPNIALRAIAITGISLTSSNAVTQNWSATPVSGYLDLRRLQLFYSYAVNRTGLDFSQFEDRLNLGATGPKRRLSEEIGPLPQGPFIEINTADHCKDGIEQFANISLDRVCFRPGKTRLVNGLLETLTAKELRSLFVLWSVAVPALSEAGDDNGAERGSSPRRSGSIPPPAFSIR